MASDACNSEMGSHEELYTTLTYLNILVRVKGLIKKRQETVELHQAAADHLCFHTASETCCSQHGSFHSQQPRGPSTGPASFLMHLTLLTMSSLPDSYGTNSS